MRAYLIPWQQMNDLLHAMSVVVGEGLPYSWEIAPTDTELIVYMTDDPAETDITYTYVDLTPVIPTTPLPPPPSFTVSDCDPVTAAAGGEDVMLLVHGTNFQPTDQIIFGELEPPTTFVAANELATIIHPVLYGGGTVIPVQVRQADVLQPPSPSSVTFTFTGEAANNPTGVIPGTPGSFTPAGSTVPASLLALQVLGALGQTTAWTESQYVVLGDQSLASWQAGWQMAQYSTGVQAGTPGSFTPPGRLRPQTLAALQALGPLGQGAAWTVTQYVTLGDASRAYWNGTTWAGGEAPGTAPPPTPPTGVTSGTPGSFTPPGSTVPADLPALQALGALGQTTAWTTGQYVTLGDASQASWDGAAWDAGAAL